MGSSLFDGSSWIVLFLYQVKIKLLNFEIYSRNILHMFQTS